MITQMIIEFMNSPSAHLHRSESSSTLPNLPLYSWYSWRCLTLLSLIPGTLKTTMVESTNPYSPTMYARYLSTISRCLLNSTFLHPAPANQSGRGNGCVQIRPTLLGPPCCRSGEDTFYDWEVTLKIRGFPKIGYPPNPKLDDFSIETTMVLGSPRIFRKAPTGMPTQVCVNTAHNQYMVYINVIQ